MTAGVHVRPVESADAAEWARLRVLLWPEWPDDHPPEIAAFLDAPRPREAVFVADAGEGRLVGMAEFRLRDVADGCDSSPVGYLEGIVVDEDARRRGVAGLLLAAGEAWARARGCTEMASDRALDNDPSGRFHEAAGFDEVARAVLYRKAL